jgi:hypothetical protein
MTKTYQFKFIFKDLIDASEEERLKGVEIPLEFNSYSEALAEAKFYFDMFFGLVWQKHHKNNDQGISLQDILDETFKIASSFELIPNESNFDFLEYAKSRDSFYKFKKSMSSIFLK